MNAEAIDHAFQHGWINEWENDFYFDVMRKRKLTAMQRAKKIQINEKLLLNMRRKK